MPTRERRGPTLVDVAREAGVSVATASRAFNGSSRQVRPNLREAVLAAATRLNYTPNTQAQAMVRGRTDVIGLVVSDIADPYFSALASGISEAAEERRLLVTLCTTNRDPNREIDYLGVLRGQRSRAVIMAGSRTTDRSLEARVASEIESFRAGGGRVAAISQARHPVDTMVIGNRSGARDLAEQVAGQGYHSFAVLSGPPHLLTARDRCDGFRQGLAGSGLAPPVVVPGEFTRDGGYAAMQQVLALPRRPDCVFAVNDVMAMGALAACRDAGLQLPTDMGMCGFDDIPTLRDVHPALTTVRLPLREMGRMALELATDAGTTSPRRRRIRGEVLLRESTPAR